jgi:hypothetical protein
VRKIVGLAGMTLVVLVLGGGAVRDGAAAAAPPLEILGAWHCSDDACLWGSERAWEDFDAANRWLVDRGDGRPSVNLVVLSFVNPLGLLRGTTDANTVSGVPRGMTPEIVDYFTSRGVRVMLSIGGITYVKDWNTALAENAAQLGLRAAALARDLGVGIEIDYEENRSPDLDGLQAFIDAYRAVHPYDATGENPAARLTIDLAAGDRWLIALTRKATAEWLRTDLPVLDYANAMVPNKQPSASAAIANWREHVDGKPQYDPPIPPLAPAKFTGAVYLAGASRPRPECVDFARSLQSATGAFVQTIAPNGAGTTSGMLGYMFWAAERASSRGLTTAPPNTCEGGVGAAATAYGIPVPMGSLRQE